MINSSFHKNNLFVVLSFFIVGLVVGLFIGDIPFYKLDYVEKVSIANIFSIIITASAILAAPFVTKKLIEDNRALKNSSLSDLNEFQKTIDEIHEKFKNIYLRNKITNYEKHELIRIFEKSDRSIYSLHELIKDNCRQPTIDLMNDLLKKYFDYWQIVTGENVTGNKVNRISTMVSDKEINSENAISFSAAKLKSRIITI